MSKMTPKSPLKTHLWPCAPEIGSATKGKVLGKDRELIFEPLAMRYQWAIQIEFAFGIGCTGQKLGGKIWEKSFGLIRI